MIHLREKHNQTHKQTPVCDAALFLVGREAEGGHATRLDVPEGRIHKHMACVLVYQYTNMKVCDCLCGTAVEVLVDQYVNHVTARLLLP